MTYACIKHKDFGQLLIRFVDLKNGHGCPYCANERLRILRSRPRGPSKRRPTSEVIHTIEDLRDYYSSRGFALLEETYVNSQTYMRHKCEKHPNELLSMPLSEFKRKTGCRQCAIENRSGENHPYWKGGISSLSSYLRSYLGKWKEDVIKLNGNECYITGVRSDELDIHHVEPFYKIRDEVMKDLALPIHENISEYTDDELTLLTRKIVEAHRASVGVPIRQDVHKLFHEKYGNDVDAEDLETFRKRYKDGKYSQRGVA